jgi:Ca-activated chloride channel family protein
VKFAVIFWLIAIAVLMPACVLLVRWGARRQRAMLDRVIAPRLREQLLRSVDYGRRRFKTALWMLALVALLLSLARPLFGHREIKVERPGVDLMIALDISKSMLAEDAGASNRLHAAKSAILRLLDRPSGDRIGLIAFAGEAFLMTPITQDHQAVVRSLEALTTTATSKPGSDIAAALKLAVQSFDPKQQSGKAVVLISDGEELQGDAIVAAREVATKGVSIFTVGVGSTTGTRIADRTPPRGYERPQFDVKYAKNEFGQEVVSRLNERVLQQVAVAGRGFYVALGDEGQGLITISERGLAPLARGTEIRKSKDLREFFQIPLGLCVALLLWEMLVNERRKVQKPTTP